MPTKSKASGPLRRKCPRCGGPLGWPALSRVSASLKVDVRVCGPCGGEEARIDPLGEHAFFGWARPPRVVLAKKVARRSHA
jgi:hypothetical protein